MKKNKVILCRISGAVKSGSLNFSPRSKAIGMFYLQAYCMANETLREHYSFEVVYYPIVIGAGEIADSIIALKPDIVGFSCYVTDYAVTIEAAKRIKERSPNTRIILGGPNVGDARHEIDRREFVDAVIPFEGELAFEAYLAALAEKSDISAIPGLAFRRDCETRFTGLRNDCVDLTRYPEVFTESFAKSLSGSVIYQTTRGCGHHCAFCISAGVAYREFPIERVKRDLGFLLDNPAVDSVYLADLDLSSNLARLEELLAFIAEKNLRNIRFHAFFSSTQKIMGHLDLLESAGFLSSSVGEFTMTLQSGNTGALQTSRRAWFNTEKLTAITPAILERYPKAKVELMMGLPGETPQSFRNTLKEIFLLGYRDFYVFDYYVVPGTEFYNRRAELGIQVHDDEEYLLKSTPDFSADEILKARVFEDNFRVLTKLLDPKDAPLYEKWGLDIVHIADNCDFTKNPKSIGILPGAERIHNNYLKYVDIKTIDILMEFLRDEMGFDKENIKTINEYLTAKFIIHHFENHERALLGDEGESREFPLIRRYLKLDLTKHVFDLLNDGDGATTSEDAVISTYIFFNKHRKKAFFIHSENRLFDDFMSRASKERSLRGLLGQFDDADMVKALEIMERFRDEGFLNKNPLQSFEEFDWEAYSPTKQHLQEAEETLSE